MRNPMRNSIITSTILVLVFAITACTKRQHSMSSQEENNAGVLTEGKKVVEPPMSLLDEVGSSMPRPDRIVLTAKITMPEEKAKELGNPLDNGSSLVITLEDEKGVSLNNAIIQDRPFPYVYSVRAGLLKKNLKKDDKIRIYARVVKNSLLSKNIVPPPAKGELVGSEEFVFKGMTRKDLLRIDPEDYASFNADYKLNLKVKQ